MPSFKQISILLFIYTLLFLIIGCGVNKPTEINCSSNESPVITCPPDTIIPLGSEYSYFVNAVDADSDSSELIYSLIDNAGFWNVSIDSTTGEFTWTTLFNDAFKGAHSFTVVVADGSCAEANADTCTFDVVVTNYLITIERTHGTIQGQGITVDLTLQSSGFEDYPMGSFEFLIEYNESALTFQSVDPGQFITDCGWEYFTYRYKSFGVPGEIIISSVAEIVNGAGNHPNCFTPSGATSNQLAVLNFLVTNDRTFECTYAPIKFIWYDCADNTISDVSGDQLHISNHIYNFEDTNSVDYSYNLAGNFAFPTNGGANNSCETSLNDSIPDPLRFIDFVNGGVEIICADSIIK